MKIYDISQEVFGCQVYPGDPAPEKQILQSMETGEVYNLTAFSMCAHNGTHIDAPFHFLGDGKTVDRMGLEVFALCPSRTYSPSPAVVLLLPVELREVQLRYPTLSRSLVS